VPKLLKRCYGAGDLHFITCSCYRRQPVLGTASRRDLFLTVLERVRRRYRLVVIGYVVMPEHFHLLITEPQVGDPSVVMQALKLGFARRMLAEMARTQVSKGARPVAPVPNHVWQARFYDFNLYRERKRIEKLRSSTAILWNVDWWPSRISGCGAVSALICTERSGRFAVTIGSFWN
jgi:putative transposase